MSRFTTCALALALAALAPAADPAPSRPAPPGLEFAVLDGDAVARLEVRAELDGAPVSALWNESFAKMFVYFDRNGDGALDATEVARLPAPRALRHALGSGFTPPVGTAPALTDLDADKNGKVSVVELAAYYRANGIGGVQVGAGRLPASAALGAALVKHLDTNGDGLVSEKEWAASPDVLKKLDKNDDELIGAGELVPNAVYPGAAGSLLLAPPTAGASVPEGAAHLPLVMLPTGAKSADWVAELERRNPKLKGTDFAAWRAKAPAAQWHVKLTATGAPERFAFAGSTVRVEGWCAAGRLPDAVAAAREQFTGTPNAPEPKGGRRGAGLDWLTPIADRDGDGVLDAKEIGAWLDLQAQIARGQLFLTVLDGGGLFELLDTNHDGALSVRELRAAWGRLRASGCTTDGTFDAMKLPRTVLVAASWGYPKALSADARRGPAWFRAMDRNGDGDVSRREFTGPADVFDKLDTDKDGLLSAEETAKTDSKK